MEAGDRMEKNVSMRELTTADLAEVVDHYISVFSAEPWNDQLTVPNHRLCIINDGNEYFYWLSTNRPSIE